MINRAIAAAPAGVLQRARTLSAERAGGWTYVAESSRDLRLDFVRGACVVGMICNHVAGTSWARTFSLSNGILITPAEGFVFISGFVFGMIYRRQAEQRGLGAAIEKALGRAWTLYRLTVILTFLFTIALLLDGWPDGAGVGSSLLSFAADVLLLHRTIYLVDVLMMWTILVGLGALSLWFLVRGHTAWLLLGSFALWLGYQVDPAWASGVPWPIVHNDLFHIAAWQMPFLFAVALGYHRQRLLAWYGKLWVPALLAAGAVFAALVYVILVPTSATTVELLSQKQAEPVRILACLFVFQLVRALVTYAWRPLRAGLGWLFLPLGQASLYVYALHLALIGAMWIPAEWVVGSETWNTAIQLGTVLVAWYCVRRRFLFGVIPH